ncbi:PIG-L deacetylase family protein [Fibrobacterota bacterium]
MTKAAVIVAHPDDETLWAGGTILRSPSWNWFVAALCRSSDEDRAPRFRKAIKLLAAEGAMGGLDDGPDQAPLDENEVRKMILSLIPCREFDLVITHNPRKGEYTRHRRHEETGKAVIELWKAGEIKTRHLWTFAYTDEGKRKCPKPEKASDYSIKLTQPIWARKYQIITGTYGFGKKSFEARTAPRREAFRCFKTSEDADYYLQKGRHKP